MSYGTLTDPATLTLQRRLPGPIERVWSYLVESDLRRQWLAAGEMELREGASFELVWRNDELSASAAEHPEGFGEEGRETCRILEVRAPERLRFDWPGAGEVTFDLKRAGDEVLLTVTHRQVPDRDRTVQFGSGWHMHLDILVARVAGTPPPSFWSGWKKLRAEYEARI